MIESFQNVFEMTQTDFEVVEPDQQFVDAMVAKLKKTKLSIVEQMEDIGADHDYDDSPNPQSKMLMVRYDIIVEQLQYWKKYKTDLEQ